MAGIPGFNFGIKESLNAWQEFSGLLLATGGAKASILAKAVEGPITAMISASAMQLHPNCKVIVDEEAARELKERNYYDWIFHNEPEWQEFRDLASP